MSRVHSRMLGLIQAIDDPIDLEMVARYLTTILSKLSPGGGEQRAIVEDYLSKVIDGINDHLDAEPELCERPYRERLELHRAIDRVAA